MSEFSALYRKFSFLPHDENYYNLAFTHPSYNGMVGTRHQDYERLEFLGDSLMGFATSFLCFKHHPSMSPGDLSVLKAQFIRTDSEAEYCKKLGLHEFIKVGPSFQNKITESKSVLEDVFESFIGALILDQGEGFAFAFLLRLLDEDIKKAEIHNEINPKSVLQEAMQADKKESVTYKILAETGPSHNKLFTAAVYFENEELGRGVGKNKKAAETEAAREALKKLACK